MLEDFANIIAYSKFNILNYYPKRLLCLISQIKYANISYVLDFFYNIEPCCRSPPKVHFKKIEMNRRKDSAIRGR